MVKGNLTSIFIRKGVFRTLDVLSIYIAGICTYSFRFESFQLPTEYHMFLLFVSFISLNIFHWFSLYSEWRGESALKEIARITGAFLTLVLVIGLILFLVKAGSSFSRLWVGWSVVSAYFLIITYRFLFRLYLKKIRISGKNLRRVVVVGAGALGKRAVEAMINNPWAGYKPVSMFDDDVSLHGFMFNKVPVAGNLDDVSSFIEAYRKSTGKKSKPIDQVWIALPMRAQARIEALQEQLRDSATNVYFVPDLYGFNLANYQVEEKIGLPVMNMSASTMQGSNAIIKRTEDVIISLICILVISPILLIIAILIKLDSPGNIFFKQRRYGVDGKEILVWKFRSMTVTEDGDTVTQAKRNDSRVTRIGAFLRKSSLDELPQLFNVLQGTMSLVGPRPHAVAHNEFYRKKVQGYMERHKIRPGITGWAQVNGSRGETSEVAQMEERVRYDLEYIRNWSLGLDLRILFKTVITVLNSQDTY